ncbi:MAG: DUF1190 domain-containing protein [Halopseudomonas sp.]
MKRTKQIDLQQMRKQPLYTVTKLAAAIGGVIALAGCGDNKVDAKIYASIDDCKNDNQGEADVCEAAYQRAVAESETTAPKYRSNNDCAAEFGNCEVRHDRNGNSWFMPALGGFMLGQMLDGRRYSSPVYTGYGSLYGGYYGADGKRYGDYSRNSRVSNVKVSPDAFKPKPKVTRTISRGGFGSKAAAKSSWGGSRSGGWGG